MACVGCRRDGVAGVSAARLVGLRRAWLAAAAVVCGVVPLAEGYSSTLMGFIPTTTTSDPLPLCVSEYGGFLPNLIDAAKDAEMQTLVLAIFPPGATLAPLSGTIGSSPCKSHATCIWQWREGPFADNPMTFYEGFAGGIPQPAGTTYYSRWIPTYPQKATANPRANYYMRDNKGWMNYINGNNVGAVICEVPNTTSPPPTTTTTTTTTPPPTTTTTTTTLPPTTTTTTTTTPPPTTTTTTTTTPPPTTTTTTTTTPPTTTTTTPTTTITTTNTQPPATPPPTLGESTTAAPTTTAPTTPKPATVAPPADSRKSSSSFKWWMGAIIAVGVALLGILCAVIFFCCCREKGVSLMDDGTGDVQELDDYDDYAEVEQVGQNDSMHGEEYGMHTVWKCDDADMQ